MGDQLDSVGPLLLLTVLHCLSMPYQTVSRRNSLVPNFYPSNIYMLRYKLYTVNLFKPPQSAFRWRLDWTSRVMLLPLLTDERGSTADAVRLNSEWPWHSCLEPPIEDMNLIDLLWRDDIDTEKRPSTEHYERDLQIAEKSFLSDELESVGAKSGLEELLDNSGQFGAAFGQQDPIINNVSLSEAFSADQNNGLMDRPSLGLQLSVAETRHLFSSAQVRSDVHCSFAERDLVMREMDFWPEESVRVDTMPSSSNNNLDAVQSVPSHSYFMTRISEEIENEWGSRVTGKLLPANNHLHSVKNPVEHFPSQSGRGRQSKDEQMASEQRLPVNAAEIGQMSLPQLQMLLRCNHLNAEQKHLIRKIRRRGKNKIAARSCRQKRGIGLSMLQIETGLLEQKCLLETDRRDQLKEDIDRELKMITSLHNLL